MNSNARCRAYFGLGAALAAFALNWLLTAEGSPLYRHFLYHTTLPNLWAAVNAIPYVLALVLAALSVPDPFNYHAGLFAQWFALGFLLAWLPCRRRARPPG